MRQAAMLGSVLTTGFLLLAASATGGAQTATKKAAAAPKPVASVRQLMDYILIPTSNALFDVGSKEPKTDADWAEVKRQAVLLAEGGQLLLAPGRTKPGVWTATSRQLITAGADSVKAVEAKDLDKLIEVGDAILTACEGCHKQYLPK